MYGTFSRLSELYRLNGVLKFFRACLDIKCIPLIIV